jgi:hypothetical protein
MYCASRFRLTGNSSKLSIITFTITLVINAGFLSLPATTFAQGLGASIQLQQKQAPKIYLPRNEFSVSVTSQPQVPQDSLTTLKAGIENQLPKYNWALKINDANPDILIVCTITQISSHSFWSTKFKSVYKKTGSHTVYDEFTKLNKTVDDYGYVQESYHVTEVRGSAAVRYEIKDAAAGNRLDLDTLKASYWQEHEFGAPGAFQVYSIMLYSIANQIAQRFLPAFHAIDVPLPKGELKRASELLKKQKWNSALKLLQSTSAFNKPETEAYRLYAVGLVFEALAYESPDLLSTKAYLEQAEKYYTDAEQKNVNEKVFREANLRLSANLQSYKKFAEIIHQHEDERKRKAFENIIAVRSKNLPSGGTLVTNDSIIELAKSGKSEKEILSKIKKAKAKVFDLSTVASADLTNAGVTAATIDEMREAMREAQYTGKPRRKWLAFGFAYLAMFYPYLILL